MPSRIAQHTAAIPTMRAHDSDTGTTMLENVDNVAARPILSPDSDLPDLHAVPGKICRELIGIHGLFRRLIERNDPHFATDLDNGMAAATARTASTVPFQPIVMGSPSNRLAF